MPILTCVYPECTHERERTFWCYKHWGLFPHKCVTPECKYVVQYDDEPWCFNHSPDVGSSKRGYSAVLVHREITDPYVSDTPESSTF